MPKEAFTDERYAGLSTDAKLLYGILIDRMELSSSNGWQDERGRVYLYYTVEQVCDLLGFGRDKIRKLFCELEELGLIDRAHQGVGKTYIIFVKRFCDRRDGKSAVNMAEKSARTQRKNRYDRDGKTDTNHTEYNHTEINDTESSIIYDDELLTQRIKYQIDYDILLERMDKGRLDEMVGIITDLMSICSPVVRIGRYEYPQSVVRNRMKQINAGHIEYVLERLSETGTKIFDMKSYLASALFNAPTTMDNYYLEQASRDWGYQ